MKQVAIEMQKMEYSFAFFLLPFIFPMIFTVFLFAMEEVIKVPYMKAFLERVAIVHLTTELFSLFNLKRVLLFCSAWIISFTKYNRNIWA